MDASPLESVSASLTSRVLLFAEIKARLISSGFGAEEEEIKRMLLLLKQQWNISGE